MLISKRHKKACDILESNCIAQGMDEFHARAHLHNALVKLFNRIERAEERAAKTKEENKNSAPLAELKQWCEQKMIDCRATADPDDALSCELAECGFHNFLTMREKVDSMLRAACPAEKPTGNNTPKTPPDGEITPSFCDGCAYKGKCDCNPGGEACHLNFQPA